jgi:hypothetical protein
LVLGDFCIREEYRTLGPAIQLNRACLSEVAQGGAAFCYDFPSQSMMAVYKRLRIHPFGQMIRFAKVLRWGRRIRDAVPVPGIRDVLGMLGTVADHWPRRQPTPPKGITLALVERCDSSFDDLDRANRDRFGIYLQRSSAYLNWRYRANPLERHDILAARRGAELQGCVVFTQAGADALIVDLLSRDDGTTALLLDELAAFLRQRGAATISAPVLSSHPFVPFLLRSQFRPRETSPVILYSEHDSGRITALGNSGWPLMYGDRDS